MKKIIISSFALFLTISSFAQNGKVISAYNYMDAFIHGEGPINLEEAAKNIDIAVNDPATASSSKAWWYRAKIYQLISSESNTAPKFPTASLEAVKSYQKLKDINDPKFKDWSDVYEYLKTIGNNLFNDGITAFNQKKYHDAYLFFIGVSDAQDVLSAKGQKINTDLLGKALGNAALSAENDKDITSAIATYKKGIVANPDSTNNYISLISLLKKTKDTEGAKNYTDQALAKFPSNRDLLIDKINFFLTEEKYADAIAYIKKAVEGDPKNEQLQAAMGVAYDQIKDTANARKVYENLLVMNPSNVEANRGIGGMIFNNAKPIQEKMNALGATKDDLKKYDDLKAQRDAIFMQAKPYLDKALAGKPDDAEIKKILVTIEAMTRKQ